MADQGDPVCPVPGAELIVDRHEVARAMDRLAAALQPQADADGCVLLMVLMGGLIPGAMLAERLSGDLRLAACQVSRYRGGLRGQEPRWLLRPTADLAGRTVLLVDDIYDEGLTLEFVAQECRRSGAARVMTITLAWKRRKAEPEAPGPDHFGVEVPDRYVFGCGMDYGERWRHLPDIFALPAETLPA